MTSKQDASIAAVSAIPDTIRRGDVLYISGFVGVQGEDEPMIEVARRMFSEFAAAVEAEGFSKADVVSCQLFIADYNDFDDINIAWGECFPENPPGRTGVCVGFKTPQVRCEINGIAHRA